MRKYTNTPVNGSTYGKWTVIDNTRVRAKEHHRFASIKCRCECGTVEYIRVSSLTTGKTTGCKCVVRNLRIAERNSRSVGLISTSQYSKWKDNATYRGLQWELSMEFLWELFNKQHGKCALSGATLTINLNSKDPRINNISIDRIDSSKGYIPTNVQFVLKKINFMKQSFSQQDFIQLCNNVAKLHPQ